MNSPESKPKQVIDTQTLRGLGLRNLVRPVPHPDKVKILSYLRASKPRAAAAGLFQDFLAPGSPRIEPLLAYGDDDWIWTNQVTYYVDRYNLELSEEFVAHMRAQGWRSPVERS
ncbi:MAG: hypothetical protein K8T20_17910 [Planctomycetes bacterium]|nr:hypothetical protein [Planctomycetota bacterium]